MEILISCIMAIVPVMIVIIIFESTKKPNKPKKHTIHQDDTHKKVYTSVDRSKLKTFKIE